MVFWGRKGENFLHDYTQNGKRPIIVLGSLKQDRWEDKNGGGKRSKHKINADDVTFIPRGQGSGGQQQSNTWGQPAPTGQDQPPF